MRKVFTFSAALPCEKVLEVNGTLLGYQVDRRRSEVAMVSDVKGISNRRCEGVGDVACYTI
jgi:hypothetical protein